MSDLQTNENTRSLSGAGETDVAESTDRGVQLQADAQRAEFKRLFSGQRTMRGNRRADGRDKRHGHETPANGTGRLVDSATLRNRELVQPRQIKVHWETACMWSSALLLLKHVAHEFGEDSQGQS